MTHVRDRDSVEKSAQAKHAQRDALPPVLLYAFRPMFFAAGSWAAIAIALWLAMFFGYAQLPTRFDPLSWHIHEMLFGFVMAAVAGFLLTAIPNWTGRLPVRGYGLATLVCLWMLGRLACLISADLPAWLAVAIDLAFPAALLLVAAREIVAGRNWRNLATTAPLAVFLIADLLMHLEALGEPVPAGLGWRLGIAAPLILIGVIGGRIIPSFSHNWLFKRKSPRLPVAANHFDTACVVILALGFILWAFLPEHRLTGVVLIAAGLFNAARLSRWAGWPSWPEKLVFILHVGYAWVALGTTLLGLSIFDVGVPAPSAVHALTAGAITVMILAVMPRVTLGHTGRALTAGRATVAIFILVNAAAIVRVCATWHTALMATLLLVAGALWIAAFLLFELIYGPMLFMRRVGS
ncbi:MAG: NnrS family protein [Proteobacteria bacterium]|nr:NnrS family protein [Pseudomonadota bacterium]